MERIVFMDMSVLRIVEENVVLGRNANWLIQNEVM